MKKPVVIAALPLLFLLAACDPVPTDFVVTNMTGQSVDLVFVTNQGSAFDDWDYYRSLDLGDIDLREPCRACNLRPDSWHDFDWKITESTRMLFVARSSENGSILFKAEFDHDQLKGMDWRVAMVDQRQT